MENLPAVKVETDQQDLEQLKVEASPDTVIIPNYHKTCVKTETEPTRWIVYGSTIKLKEEQEDFGQQGRT